MAVRNMQSEADDAIDGDDPDCITGDAEVGYGSTQCTDGVDNDGDGAMDCADPDCADLCGASEGQDCTLAGFGSMTTASCPAPSKGRLVPRTCPVDCATALATWRACAGSAAVIGQADAALDGQLTPFVGLCAAAAIGGH